MRNTHLFTISAQRPMAAQTTGLEAKATFLEELMTTLSDNYAQIINNIRWKDWIL